MIKIINLGLTNFFSHKDSDIDLSSKKGLVLIEGSNSDGRYDSNGSGKSTILEGIVYALSGNTLRNVGVNDVVNRNEGKDTQVFLRVKNSYTNFYYDIHRYRKHTVKGDKLDVYRGDASGTVECLSKRLNKDTQSILDNIIDIPYDILINTMLLGEGLSSRFTQLSDADKKSLIESTLNLSYDLSKSRDAANSRLKELKLQKASLEGKISTLESLLSEDIESKKSQRVSQESDMKDLLEHIKSVEASIERDTPNLQTYQDKISLLTASINEYDSLTAQQVQLDAENVHHIEEINRIINSEVPTCSLCKQVLQSSESRDTVINSFREKVDANSVLITGIQQKLFAIPSVDTMRSKVQELTQLYQSLSADLNAKNQDLISSRIKLATVNKEIEYADSLISNYEEYQKQLDESQSALSDLNRDISDYEYFYKLYSPTGIMVNILEEAISYINTRMKVYTEILLDKSYRLILEKGKILLKDSSGASYQSLSNGEKRRLDLCIQFSLHDYTHIYCGTSIDSLFLDEVLDTLDVTGVNNIIEVLRLKMEYCKLSRILVVSHNPMLRPYFDEIITVRKDSSGNSYIVN